MILLDNKCSITQTFKQEIGKRKEEREKRKEDKGKSRINTNILKNKKVKSKKVRRWEGKKIGMS